MKITPALPETMRTLLPDSAAFTGDSLAVGGLALSDLAAEFGTPLYVYDAQTLRAEARDILAAFAPLDARVSYASKACETIGVLRILHEEGLDLDVVSEGELIAGLRAGFRPDQIHLHGNYKTDAELDAACRLELHAIVVDNLEELKRLQVRAERNVRSVRVMLRVTLPIEAETHPHLQTSGYRSKFGFHHGSQEEAAATSLLRGSEKLILTGLHAHLGSQIGNLDIYRRAATDLIAFGCTLREAGFPIGEISVGGGWAAPYRVGDKTVRAPDVAAVLETEFRGSGFRPAVEPGRAVVARAAVALYRVGSVKSTADTRIVAVDGGMGDNPRPALYGACYDTLLPERPMAAQIGPANVVGRYCEASDSLALEVPLPEVAAGDLLCIPMAGAYQLSMASSYNLVPQPAVVLVEGGHARLLVRRASIDDLLRREVTDASS